MHTQTHRQTRERHNMSCINNNISYNTSTTSADGTFYCTRMHALGVKKLARS